MYYIYQHSNSKITTGMMAGYREKKPDIKQNCDCDNMTICEEYCRMDGRAQRELAFWEQQSLIGYIKQPEFKVGEWVYYANMKVEIKKLFKKHLHVVYKTQLISISYKQCSHYYEGQQVESFKYVREVINMTELESGYVQINDRKIWQEVEEPYKENGKYSDYSIKNAKTFEEEYTQFQEDKKQGKILATL